MKPWIAKETAAKVTIMGSDYRSTLLELVDEDALPQRLGGTCTCDGLGGCMKSNAGPWMHERKLRREAWLRGERDTMAILPEELTGPIQVKKPAPKEAAPPDEQKPSADAGVLEPSAPSSEDAAASPPDSSSDSSSVESSTLGTPPLSEMGQDKNLKKAADVSEGAVYEHPSEQEQLKAVSAR